MGRIALLLVSAVCLFLAGQHFTAGQPTWNRGYLKDVDLHRLPGEPSWIFAARVTQAVHDLTWHCPASLTGMSLIERGLTSQSKGLFVHGLLVKERFHCGVCSQRAYMLKKVLAEGSVRSDLYFISYHVVLRSGDVVMDPDYGIPPFKLGDHVRAYAAEGVRGEWPGFVAFNYARPSPEKDQALFNSVMEFHEARQRAYFKLANVLAFVFAALGAIGFWLAIREP